MGKVLKADASAADAWVEIDLGADQSDVWVTFSLYFSTATAAFWAGTDSGYFASLYLDPFTQTDYVLVGAHRYTTGFSPHDGTPVGDAWILVEHHHVNGGASTLYLAGSLVASGTDGLFNDTRIVRIGQEFATPDPAGIAYFDDVKIGTTRGADDLFSDDFESGTLAAWDTSSGSVSVVDDPVAPPSITGGVRFSVAFDDIPLEPDPDWTVLTALDGCSVQSWSSHRGSPDEFTKASTGTATVRIADQEGLFDPTNGAGPYFGLILPDRQAMIELHNPVLDEWKVVFRGHVEDWNYELDLTRQVFFVDVALVDGFAILNDAELMPGQAGDTPPAGSEGRVFYEDTAGPVRDRILAILADVGWPSGLYSIFSGNVRVTETVYEPGTEALAALFDAADAEFPGGVAKMYISKDGILIFHGRQARFRPDVAQYGINRRDVADPSLTDSDATVCPVHELGFNLGKASLFNSVLAVPQDATVGVPPTETESAAQLVEDTASITAHGKKGLAFTDLLTLEGRATGNTALQETLVFATYFRDNYKDPLPRVNRMVFKTRMPEHRLAGPLWKMLTRVEISDLLTLTTAHPGGGGFDEDEFYVEGIHYDCRPGNDQVPVVTLTLDVSPQAFFVTNPFDDDPDPDV